MRGRASEGVTRNGNIGITPAYAGKRLNYAPRNLAHKDHPRVCGEEPQPATHSAAPPGSPPRMRGRAAFHSRFPALAGITPAYAGKSPRATASRAAPWDHPRVCGEERHPGYRGKAPVGSPPRMRGRDLAKCKRWKAAGITPAYAGKRWTVAGTVAARWDHPRVCGEELYAMLAFVEIWGSPPRMRGRGTLAVQNEPQFRITPAYAGKSGFRLIFANGFGDHPRVCGEEFYIDEVLPGDTGSPPRMRGRGGPSSLCRVISGITPAYAGKSGSTGYQIMP